MQVLSTITVLMVAVFHVGFLLLEMFLWTKPAGLKVFRQTPSQAETTRVLAANQGLYNGFLAAGLLWSVLAEPTMGYSLKLFFLGCVIVAGLYGAATAARQILFVQAVPAAIALGVTLASAHA